MRELRSAPDAVKHTAMFCERGHAGCAVVVADNQDEHKRVHQTDWHDIIITPKNAAEIH